MISNFYKAFPKNINNKLNRKLIKILNEDLPKGFSYVYDESLNHYVVKPGKAEYKCTGTIELSDEIKKQIPTDKELTTEMILEWSYRTQTPLQTNDAKIIESGKELPLVKFYEDPFQGCEKTNEVHVLLKPESFPDAKSVKVKSKNQSITQQIMLRRVPYNSFTEIKIENTTFKALTFELLINEKEKTIGGKIHLNTKMAASAEEALIASELFYSYMTDGIFVDDMLIKRSQKEEANTESLQKHVDFWNTIIQLEKIFKVGFDPSCELTKEQAILVAQLERNIINKKDDVIIHPYDSFHINISREEYSGTELQLMQNNSVNALITIGENKGIQLMGEYIDFYQVSVLMGFKTVSISKDLVDDYYSCDVYIEDYNEQVRAKLIKTLTVTKEEADNAQQRILSDYTQV